MTRSKRITLFPRPPRDLIFDLAGPRISRKFSNLVDRDVTFLRVSIARQHIGKSREEGKAVKMYACAHVSTTG